MTIAVVDTPVTAGQYSAPSAVTPVSLRPLDQANQPEKTSMEMRSSGSRDQCVPPNRWSGWNRRGQCRPGIQRCANACDSSAPYTRTSSVTDGGRIATAHGIPKPSGISLVLKADDDVVGVTHDDHVARGLPPASAFGPEVEDVMQVNIGKQR